MVKKQVLGAEGLVNILGFLVQKGPQEAVSAEDSTFELTDQFREHCVDLLRCICSSASNYAVLLEGPTSAGKTSIV